MIKIKPNICIYIYNNTYDYNYKLDNLRKSYNRKGIIFMSYTIKEVSEMLNVPATTIRYYDKQGLIPFIKRKQSGYREFTEKDIGSLKIIECLKKTGMPLKEIKQYFLWALQGDKSLNERYDMFLERKEIVEEEINELKKTLEVINFKCWYYKTAIAAGTESIHARVKVQNEGSI